MQKSDRYSLPGAVLTLSLYLLVSLAVEDEFGIFFFVMLGALAASVAMFHRLFPGSRFTTIALANFLSVYICLYIFFVRANFATASDWAIRLAYVLPILTYIAGVWLRRGSIHRLVRHDSDTRVHYSPRLFLWLVPVFVIGLATFLIPHQGYAVQTTNLLLLGCMAMIALLVLSVSRDVTAFLLETGLLFEDFFAQTRALMAPTLAFFTYYSFVVIVFATIYRIIGRTIPGPHFLVAGEARSIDFIESLYFSIITLSTVGYGDLVPASMVVRAVASLQIVFGVWLIIFGFSEVLRYAREHPVRRKHN